MKKENIIEIQEEITLEQEEELVTLEKGDKIKVLEKKEKYKLYAEKEGERRQISTYYTDDDEKAKKYYFDLIEKWEDEFDIDDPRKTDKILELREGEDAVLVLPNGRELLFTGEWEEL